MRRRLTALAALLPLLAVGAETEAGWKPAAREAVVRGAAWLKTRPAEDAGVAAMALMALEVSGEGAGPEAERLEAFVLRCAREDGGIYNPEGLADYNYRNYRTSAALMALQMRDPARHAGVIRKARDWILAAQHGPGPNEGGVASGRWEDLSDLANTRIALEALRACGHADPAFYRKAEAFVSRCQNLRRADAGPGPLEPGDDGSFVYGPIGDLRLVKAGMTEAGGVKRSRGYGGATCSGIHALRLCGVPAEDPRIRAALGWLEASYTLDRNPGMQAADDPGAPQRGIYYYYLSLAKAMQSVGAKRDWAGELAGALLARQEKDGAWRNTASKQWMEGNETLTTAYVVQALGLCLASP